MKSTQPLPDLAEEVTSTVLVKSGSAPIQGGSSSGVNVPVDPSVAASASVQDMVQTYFPISTSVETQPTSAGTVGSLGFNESKTKDFEKLTNLACVDVECSSVPNRESVQGLVTTCLEMCVVDLTEVYLSALFNERSMHLDLGTGVNAELETGWNLEYQITAG